MTVPVPSPVRRRFPWWVYWIVLVFILLFTIFPFFLMVSDPNLGMMLLLTGPLGMGALMVWGIILVIHLIAWGRRAKGST